jgi:hypothetical protein
MTSSEHLALAVTAPPHYLPPPFFLVRRLRPALHVLRYSATASVAILQNSSSAMPISESLFGPSSVVREKEPVDGVARSLANHKSCFIGNSIGA